MLRFVRTLQHRVTPQGHDFYALSIPPQVAKSLDLKDGGLVAIEFRPSNKGKSEIVLKAMSQDDAPDFLYLVPTQDSFGLLERPMPLDAITTKGPSQPVSAQALDHNIKTLSIAVRML
jgi:hypothetical protein